MIYNLVFVILWIWFSRGVFGADSDAVKSVTEGDSVTLNTDVTEVQKNDQILWFYSLDSSETRIAEIYKQNIDMFDSKVMFGDRLKMDNQTGSLTITNIRTEHSGLYKLQIIGRRTNLHKRFAVAVYAPLPIPVITGNCSSSSSSSSSEHSSSICSLLCSVVNVSDVTLSWLKGNRLLSNISVSDLSISLSLPLEVEDQENNTYRCEINNPITHQTTHLDISELCHTCSDNSKKSHVIPLISAVLITIMLAVLVVGIIYIQRRKSKQARPRGS